MNPSYDMMRHLVDQVEHQIVLGNPEIARGLVQALHSVYTDLAECGFADDNNEDLLYLLNRAETIATNIV
jgi:hypothetical protein